MRAVGFLVLYAGAYLLIDVVVGIVFPELMAAEPYLLLKHVVSGAAAILLLRVPVRMRPRRKDRNSSSLDSDGGGV